MKAPVELIWELVGDVFSSLIFGSNRREIDALWQSMTDMAADSLEYTDYLQKTKNIFEVPAFAPYGTIDTLPSRSNSVEGGEGVLIGARKENYWTWYVWSKEDINFADGAIGIGNTSLDYSSVSIVGLESGGYVHKLISIGNESSLSVPSALFDSNTDLTGKYRWSDEGSGTAPITPTASGLEFDIQPLNWSILVDQKHMSASTDWNNVYKFSVSRWDVTTGMRTISVNSYGDVGIDFEVKIREEGGKVYFDYGEMGNTSSIEMSEWKTLLEAGSTDIEISITYVSSKSEINAKVWVGGVKAEMPSTMKVRPGRRTHKVDVFSESSITKLTLNYVACTRGELWEGSDDPYATINDHFAFYYDIEEPIVKGNKIMVSPWDLAPEGSVVSSDSEEVTFIIGEEWEGYSPEHIRTDDGFFLSRKDGLTYEIVKNIGGGTLSGKVKLHPWFLKRSEINWVETGSFTTKHIIPEDTRVWITQAQGREVDLYGRYGKLLGLPKREDSESYLQTVRAFQAGLLTAPTHSNIKRSVSILSGIPYSVKGGTIKSITRIRGDLGEALYDEVYVSGDKTYKVDPYWKDVGLLRSVGSKISFMGTLAKGVDTYDWVKNPEFIYNHVNPWGRWGTFAVKVPASIGLSIESKKDVSNFLDRVKDQHTDYIIEFDADSEEDQRTDASDHAENCVSANKVEDLIFDDLGTVVNNDMLMSGQYIEQQTDEAMDDGAMLDEGKTLGYKNTVRLKSSRVEVGKVMGDNYDRSLITKDKMYHGNSGIHLKRPGPDWNPLRMAPDYRYEDGTTKRNYHPRSYELHWAVDDVTGDLLSYHTQGMNKEADLGANDIFMHDEVNIIACTDLGGIFRSSDYGENWTQETSNTSNNIVAIHNNYACTNSSELLSYNGVDWDVSVVEAGAILNDVWSDGTDIVVVVGQDSVGDATIFFSDDGGTSWTKNVNGAGEYSSLDCIKDQAGNITMWLTAVGSTGAGKSIDNGASFSDTFSHPSQNLNGIYIAGPDDVWACADSGSIVRYKDGSASTTTFSGRGNVLDIDGNRAGSLIACGASGEYYTYDDGTWSLGQNSLDGNYEACSAHGDWHRVITGPPEFLRWY